MTRRRVVTRARFATVGLVMVLVLAGCEVRLGNDDPTFGIELAGDLNGDGDGNDAGECISAGAPCAGGQPIVWAAINSPFYERENGDPYASRCLTGTTCTTVTNPEYRVGGYRYGVEVAEAGQVVTVEVYDAPTTQSASYAGDRGAFRIQYEVFGEDGSPAASTTPDLSLAGSCDAGPGFRNFPPSFQPSTYTNRWWTLCTFTAPVAGTYVVQVKVDGLSEDPSTGAAACDPCTATSNGISAFALRATAAAGPAPSVSALGDMSLWLPPPGTRVTHSVIEVPADRAGDQVVVDLYDVGDTYTMMYLELNRPGGANTGCRAATGAVDGARLDPPATTTNLSYECVLQTGNTTSSAYNGRWLRLTAPVPTNYTCTDDCWWTVTWPIGTTSTSWTDRVTVTAAITETP
jgi:hypothetical protein